MINGIPFISIATVGKSPTKEEEKPKIDRLSKKKIEIKESIKKVNEYTYK